MCPGPRINFFKRYVSNSVNLHLVQHACFPKTKNYPLPPPTKYNPAVPLEDDPRCQKVQPLFHSVVAVIAFPFHQVSHSPSFTPAFEEETLVQLPSHRTVSKLPLAFGFFLGPVGSWISSSWNGSGPDHIRFLQHIQQPVPGHFYPFFRRKTKLFVSATGQFVSHVVFRRSHISD